MPLREVRVTACDLDANTEFLGDGEDRRDCNADGSGIFWIAFRGVCGVAYDVEGNETLEVFTEARGTV